VTSPAEEWQSLSDALLAFGRHVDKLQSVNVNANSIRTEAKQVAQQYFRQSRATLQDVG
jgi:hypothetical protein